VLLWGVFQVLPAPSNSLSEVLDFDTTLGDDLAGERLLLGTSEQLGSKRLPAATVKKRRRFQGQRILHANVSTLVTHAPSAMWGN
jgi:hypothetical protein